MWSSNRHDHKVKNSCSKFPSNTFQIMAYDCFPKSNRELQIYSRHHRFLSKQSFLAVTDTTQKLHVPNMFPVLKNSHFNDFAVNLEPAISCRRIKWIPSLLHKMSNLTFIPITRNKLLRATKNLAAAARNIRLLLCIQINITYKYRSR